MARRRMMTADIILTDRFLEMPMSAQCLYFHFLLRCDDDGFVSSPNQVIRTIGASPDDYKILMAKQYIIPFASGICVIRHWKLHNYIQKDRYKETIHTEEKAALTIESNGTYEICSSKTPTPAIRGNIENGAANIESEDARAKFFRTLKQFGFYPFSEDLDSALFLTLTDMNIPEQEIPEIALKILTIKNKPGDSSNYRSRILGLAKKIKSEKEADAALENKKTAAQKREKTETQARITELEKLKQEPPTTAGINSKETAIEYILKLSPEIRGKPATHKQLITEFGIKPEEIGLEASYV